MEPVYHTEQRFSIYPTYIVSTPVYSGHTFARSKAQRDNNSNLKDNTHNGKLSSKASSKLRNAVNWLVESAQWKRVWSKSDQKSYFFKVNFVTLTIPKQKNADVNGVQLSRMLHTFLVYSRKYFYLRNYVWKIEAGKLGKIHIHITTDTFIHYKNLRESWNRIMQKEGLIDDYFQTHGHYNPNSTDVHSVKNIKRVGGYLCKYMDKDSGLDASFKNRIWGCNKELSHSNKCKVVVDVNEAPQVSASLFNSEIEWKNIKSKADSLGQQKNIGEIFFINTDTWSRLVRGKIKEAYDQHRFYIRKAMVKPPDEYFTVDSFKLDDRDVISIERGTGQKFSGNIFDLNSKVKRDKRITNRKRELVHSRSSGVMFNDQLIC